MVFVFIGGYVNEIVFVMIGVIFIGVIFGDYCLLISDIMIMSLMFFGLDYIDYVII